MGQLEHICTLKNVLLEHLYHKPLLEPKALFDELMGYRAALEPYVGDAVGFVHRALKEGRRVLLEGQLGSMKDATQVALTAIDCLGYLDEIKVCTGYEIDGKVTTDFPVPALLDRAKPVYETLPGWKCDIRGVTDYGKLPKAARDYVDFIEKHIEAPITIVSTGPKRHEICRRAGS